MKNMGLHEKVFKATKLGDAVVNFSVLKFSCPEDKKEEVECVCSGVLSIKGVKNDLSLKTTLNRKNKTVTGTGDVSLSLFKLTAPSFMGITVEDSVAVNFKVGLE